MAFKIEIVVFSHLDWLYSSTSNKSRITVLLIANGPFIGKYVRTGSMNCCKLYQKSSTTQQANSNCAGQLHVEYHLAPLILFSDQLQHSTV